MNHEDENQGLISALSERLLNGIYKENPTFVLMLGMCPTLAVTTSAVNGLGMGVSTMVVLAMSNLLISLLRKVIPDKIRIPAFIVIIASFVTIVELVMKGYIPSLYNALGLYIPLIVVNCIILGRAESYAYSHSALLSLFDGFGMGMGFTIALTIIGAFREVLGSGKVFNHMVMPDGFIPVSIFVMAPGAFFVLAMLTAIQNKVKEIGERHGKDMSKIQSGCGGNCLNCDKECKVLFPEAQAEEEAAENISEAAEDIKDQEGEVADGEIKDTDTESVSSKGLKERLFGRFKKRDEEASPESEEGDKEGTEEPEEAQESHGTEGEESDISEPSEPVSVAGSGDEDTSEHGQDTDEHNEQSEPEQEEHTEEQSEPEPEQEEHTEEQSESGQEQEEPGEEPSEVKEEPDEYKEELPETKEEPEVLEVGSDKVIEEPSEEKEETAPAAETTETLDAGSDALAGESLNIQEDSGVEMWNVSDFRSVLKRDLPSGRRPGKSRKALEKAKAMLDKAEDAAKEGDND